MAIGETQETKSVEKTVDSLNGFLRGELSAVETYRQAIEKISEPSLRNQLQQLSQSHQQRVTLLRARIVQLGGQPADDSGAWGSFAKLIEGGAKVFGVKAALAALEEGEDHGLRLYRDDLDQLDASTRSWVSAELFPEQRRSHDIMSNLKHSFH
jgi:uncharacterized protein (TIGR02284 family)